MTYSLYPAVDETFNFPPEIKQAFAASNEFLTALSGILEGVESPLPPLVSNLINEMELSVDSPLAQFLESIASEQVGPTGAPGEPGEQGSGVGPVLLGEKVMTANSNTVNGTVSTDWNGFSVVVTKGEKPICIRLATHLQSTNNANMSIGILEGANLVQAWTVRGDTSISDNFYAETITLNPAPGTYTYRVQIRSLASGGSVTGIATPPSGGFPAFMKVYEV